MKRSIDRILTTHVGSLIRPAELREFLSAKEAGRPFDQEAYAACLKDAVAEVVRKQAKIGIDVVSDGEFGKTISWSQYALERLSGFERRPMKAGANPLARGADRSRFAEFYAELDARDAPATQWEALLVRSAELTLDYIVMAALAGGLYLAIRTEPATAPSLSHTSPAHRPAA